MRTIILSLILATTFVVQAQAQKIGYTSVQEISALMPEVKLAQANLANERKRKEDQLEADLAAIQQKYINLEKNYQTYSPQQSQQIATEIQQQEQVLNQKYEQLSVDFQKKVTSTLKPIEDKISNAVKEVAQENGFDYIIETVSGTMLHAEDQYDITELVKQKLGL